MANDLTDLMQTKILPLALPVLRESAVMAALVNRDLDGMAAEKNETIRVPLPQDMGTADDDPSTGMASTDLSDEKVDVKLDQWKYKKFQMNDKEMFDTVTNGVLPSAAEAAVKSLANSVDLALLNLFKDIYTHSGVAGTTPASIAALLAGRRKLGENLAPMDNRRHVIDVVAEEALLNIDNIRKVNEAADTQALREGSLGRIVGLSHFVDQNVPAFTQTDITALTVTGVNAIGVKTFAVSAGVPVGGIARIGDLFTIAGDAQQYVVTADETLVAGAGNIAFEPALKVATAGAEAITFVRDAAATTYTNNLMFHRDAFTFVQRPLADGETGASESSSIAQETDPVSGISLRMETWRDPNSKTRFWSFDILFGVKTLRRELANRTLG